MDGVVVTSISLIPLAHLPSRNKTFFFLQGQQILKCAARNDVVCVTKLKYLSIEETVWSAVK
jgi:hypothetical protein